MLTRNLLVKSLLGAIQTETPESAATGKPTSAPKVDPRNFLAFFTTMDMSHAPAVVLYFLWLKHSNLWPPSTSKLTHLTIAKILKTSAQVSILNP